MKIYVINLERSTSRRQRLVDCFARFGYTDYEFFSAIDGRRIPAELKPLVDRSSARRRLGREMSDGEIGCALSHALVYKKILNDGVREAVVLEDDAILGDAFFELLSSGALSRSGYKHILLHCRHPRVLRWPVGSLGEKHELFRLVSEVWGATAYYLSSERAYRLWREVLPVSYVADWPVPLECWREVACLYPFVVFPPRDGSGDSTLEAERAPLMSQSSLESRSRLFRRKLVRGLSLLVLPCLIWPQVFGRVEDLKNYLYRYWLRVLSRFWGRDLSWVKPDDWPKPPLDDTNVLTEL